MQRFIEVSSLLLSLCISAFLSWGINIGEAGGTAAHQCRSLPQGRNTLHWPSGTLIPSLRSLVRESWVHIRVFLGTNSCWEQFRSVSSLTMRNDEPLVLYLTQELSWQCLCDSLSPHHCHPVHSCPCDFDNQFFIGLLNKELAPSHWQVIKLAK